MLPVARAVAQRLHFYGLFGMRSILNFEHQRVRSSQALPFVVAGRGAPKQPRL